MEDSEQQKPAAAERQDDSKMETSPVDAAVDIASLNRILNVIKDHVRSCTFFRLTEDGDRT